MIARVGRQNSHFSSEDANVFFSQAFASDVIGFRGPHARELLRIEDKSIKIGEIGAHAVNMGQELTFE